MQNMDKALQTVDYKQLTANIVARMGSDVRDVAFRIVCDDGRTWTPDDFDWTATHAAERVVLSGRREDIVVRWTFQGEQRSHWVTLIVESTAPLRCRALDSLIVSYAPQTETIGDWWVANSGATIHSVGLHRVRELDERTRTDYLLRGVFPNSRAPGLLLGTRIPQAHLHDYTIAHDGDTLVVTATTRFPEAVSEHTQVQSETTWICTQLPVRDAVRNYALHVPEASVTPIVGWNSWDYYFFTVSLDALVENMQAIQRDPVLAQHITHIVIDEGWEHRNGEWEPNYKFPGGLEYATAEITARDFIPGIWTAPVLVDPFSYTALRQPETLLKNQHGDPVLQSGHYLIDPTHPAGEAFIEQLYTRLYGAGFRLFKVDFVEELAQLHRFHRADAGPYDALRHLFATIRRCVTSESHILGCSLPAACGPGFVNSSRIGIDIHNHWSHVEWVCDYLQWCYWQHGRIWTNDPDFLVVRGADTSREPVTNVTNPKAHDSNPPRWRRGPDFTQIEAQTWASIVALAGGNVVLSDRITQLNEAGQRLIAKVIALTNVAAQPLDLCDDRRASLWLQKLPYEHRLTVINWRDEAVERVIAFDELFHHTPPSVTDFWNERELTLQDGTLRLCLKPHGCAVLVWS